MSVAQQLNLADNGTVMAGPVAGSGMGSAIDLLRSGGHPDHFSTVDNADYVTGQIVVAQALYEQMTAGRSGNYGSLASATAAAPSPAPTPSPSSTATSTAKQAASPQRTARASAHPDATAPASAR